MEYPEPLTEPKENPNQDLINVLCRLRDERDDLLLQIKHIEFHKDAWRELLFEYDADIEDKEEYLRFCRRK